MQKKTVKKIGNIALHVLLYLFLALAIFTVLLTAFSDRDDDGSIEIFGYQMRIVTSSSMEECEETVLDEDYDIGSIPVRSLIFIDLIPEDPEGEQAFYEDIEVGDVLTFRYVYTHQVTITHRVIDIDLKDDGSGYIIRLQGDNKSEDGELLVQEIDTSIPRAQNLNYVIGKVTGQSYLLGLFLSFMRSTLGIVLIIIIPCAIIIILELIKIFGILNKDKKARAREELAKKDSELEALRRQLEELQNTKASSSDITEQIEKDTISDGTESDNNVSSANEDPIEPSVEDGTPDIEKEEKKEQ